MQLLKIIEKHGRTPENLLPILTEYQNCKDTNFLSEEEIKLVAKELNIPQNKVYSTISFYSLLSTKPRGKYIVQVCEDVPCYVNNSVNIVKELEEMLKIKMGQTTSDGIFTLEHTSCIGCCDMSPAIRIDGKLYGDMNKEKLAIIILEYRRKQ